MKYSLAIISFLSILSCNTKVERVTDFGAFQITLPKEWNEYAQKGIDSYVGGITNGIDSLDFDYGRYSYDFQYEDPEKQVFATDTINGKIALFTKPKQAGSGMIGIYIEKAYEKNDFNLIGQNIINEDLILKIFKSVRFKDSDTLKNSNHIEFSSEITPYSGRSLFLINCAACHQRIRRMTGPVLASIKDTVFRKWILDSTELKSIDSSKFGIQYHRKTFGKKLTENDIDKLIEYSRLK